MNLDNLYPSSGNHAVQSMAFAIEWQGELSEKTMHAVHALAPILKPHYPTAVLQKLVMVNVGANPGQTSVVSNTDAIGGVQFQRPGKFGQVGGMMVVSRSNVLVQVNDYTRWKPVLESAMGFFGVVLKPILEEKSISAVALQYVDIFTWKDSIANLDYSKIFRLGNPYLSPNALALKSLWHSHHGFIVESTVPVLNTRLDNINVDIIENQGDRAVQILTSHRATMAEPLRKASDNYLQTIESVENELHAVNKKMLQALLTDEVCRKIDLIDK
jgi:uncharacterized protein (TIGR04255 family)